MKVPIIKSMCYNEIIILCKCVGWYDMSNKFDIIWINTFLLICLQFD